MSFAAYWWYSIGILVLLQVVTFGLAYKYKVTQLQDGEHRTLRSRVRPFLITAMLATGMWLVGSMFARSMIGGLPTFVDKMRSNKIPIESVQSIQFVEVATIEREERILAEVRDREAVSACLSALANSSVGVKNRNHPESIYAGSLRVVVKDGTRPLIPFFVLRYQGEEFAYFYSFHSRDYDWDQNCYESTDILPFLEKHDPRFPK